MGLGGAPAGAGGAPVGGALPSHSADVQAQLAQLQRAVETLAEQQAASHPCLLTMLVICVVPATVPPIHHLFTSLPPPPGRRPSGSRCSPSSSRCSRTSQMVGVYDVVKSKKSQCATRGSAHTRSASVCERVGVPSPRLSLKISIWRSASRRVLVWFTRVSALRVASTLYRTPTRALYFRGCCSEVANERKHTLRTAFRIRPYSRHLLRVVMR